MVLSSTEAALTDALATLENHLQDILRLRYGVGRKRRYTNQEIGKQYNCSARMIDELEKKAIRMLRKPGVAKPLFLALQDEDEHLWGVISEPICKYGRILSKKMFVESLFEKIPGELLILVRCAYEHFNDWLADNACETANAWFRSALDHQQVLQKLRQLTQLIDQSQLLIPLKQALEHLEIDMAGMTLLLALVDRKTRVYGDFLALSPISSLNLRAIRIQRLLLPGSAIHSKALAQLMADYNALYRDDHLIERTILPVLTHYPQLFRQDEAGNWALSEVSIKLGMPAGEETERYFERPWDEVNAMMIIAEIFEEVVFCRQLILIKIFMQRTEGRFTPMVVSGNILMSKEIIRVAPHLLGWREKCATLDHELVEPLLLNVTDCRDYINARYAGEPMTSYLCWTPAIERKWCLWAQNQDFKLYQSLLYVATPEMWPVSAEEKQIWLRKKQADAYYHLEKPLEFKMNDLILPLQDVFLNAVQLKSQGYINWIQIGATLNQRKYFLKAASVLLYMILLDIILPATNWQKMHLIGPGADDFLTCTIAEIKNKGFLDWDDQTGQRLRHRIASLKTNGDLGWVRSSEIRMLTKILKPGSLKQNIIQLEKRLKTKPALAADRFNHISQPRQLSLF